MDREEGGERCRVRARKEPVISAPNQRHPARPTDESLDSLRRLESVLIALQADVKEVKAEQCRQGERLATLEGRVFQLPTLIQIIGSVVATNAAIVAIAFGLVNVLLRAP